MKKAGVTIGLILAAILVCAMCYAAGFIQGYETGQQIALLPYINTWR